MLEGFYFFTSFCPGLPAPRSVLNKNQVCRNCSVILQHWMGEWGWLFIPCLKWVPQAMNSPKSRKTQKRMYLLVSGGRICALQSDTNMASPYNALEKWVKPFSEYLAYELPHRPDSWQGFLFIYLLSFPRFRTFCIDWFVFLFLMAWQWKHRIVFVFYYKELQLAQTAEINQLSEFWPLFVCTYTATFSMG